MNNGNGCILVPTFFATPAGVPGDDGGAVTVAAIIEPAPAIAGIVKLPNMLNIIGSMLLVRLELPQTSAAGAALQRSEQHEQTFWLKSFVDAFNDVSVVMQDGAEGSDENGCCSQPKLVVL